MVLSPQRNHRQIFIFTEFCMWHHLPFTGFGQNRKDWQLWGWGREKGTDMSVILILISYRAMVFTGEILEG